MKASITSKSNQRELSRSLLNKRKLGKHKTTSKILWVLGSACVLLLIWQGTSMLYSPLVLPGPGKTLASLIDIIQSERFFSEILISLYRFVVALILTVGLGSVLGVIIGGSKKLGKVFKPLIYIVQGIPPILYMTLAMLWFGLNGRATIFIVVIGSMPVMVVSIKEGFENIDQKLIDMGSAFQFSQKQMILDIIIPSLKPYFKSGLITVFGLGWKLVVMGEVLSASTGLGSKITDARTNLETHMVFAWGVVIVILCFAFQNGAERLLEIKPKRKKYDDAGIK